MTTRITSAISNATKSDDWRPLLVSMTTVPKAALKSPSSRCKVSGSILATSSRATGRGRTKRPGAVAGHRSLEQGRVEPLEVLEHAWTGYGR